MKFTDIYIRSLKPEEKKYYKREREGFTIRVMPSGVKTWLYVYTFDGRRKELNFGFYPDVSLSTARERHSGARKLINNGKDPALIALEQNENRLNAPTVADMISEYIERYAKKFKKSWQEDERVLIKEVLPSWGKRKLADFKKRDINLLLEGIVDRNSPCMANNTFKILRRMLNYAVEKDILPYSPAAGIKLPSPLVSRERTLSQDEIKMLFKTLNSASMYDDTCRALKLILVTAQRPGEVAGIHTDEIDGRWWTIPSDRAKNGKAHRVYLTDMALELIGDFDVSDKTGRTKHKGYIFPCPHKTKIKPLNRHALSRAVCRNLSWPSKDKKGKPLIGADGRPVTENKLGIEYFTPHDLRRTAATFLAQSGELDEVIDAVLNHTKQGVIKVYNQYRYEKEKQAALEAWERKLTSIIKGKAEDNIEQLGSSEPG